MQKRRKKETEEEQGTPEVDNQDVKSRKNEGFLGFFRRLFAGKTEEEKRSKKGKKRETRLLELVALKRDDDSKLKMLVSQHPPQLEF